MSLELRAIAIAIQQTPLIQPFSLTIMPGEVVTLMGPSGTGKSALLSYIGGDLDPAFKATGEIILEAKSLNNIPPEQRSIGRMFQDDLLFPHMTVGENLSFACARNPKTKRTEMIATALKRAELQGFENRSPHTLSGGQRMRVSLMRTLLAKPDCVLLDEPFSKLDKDLRTTMRDYVFDHITARNIPALMVTHDDHDAPKNARIFKIIEGEVRHA